LTELRFLHPEATGAKETDMRVQAGVLSRLAATWFGTKVALTSISDNDRASKTFAELNDAANRIGSGVLDMGARRGDRVGVLGYNTPEVMQAWLGFEKHNLVRAVLHSHFGMDAHVWSLNYIEASTLLFDTRFAEEVARYLSRLETVRHFVAIGTNAPNWAISYDEVAANGTAEEPELEVDEDAPCFLQLTSGTTGHPKAWVKTYRSWQAVINHNLHHLDTFGPYVPPVGPDDVNLHFHPLQWASGFQTLYPYLVRGARSVLLDDATFNPDLVVDLIVREGATGTFAPGPLLGPILDVVERRGGIDHRMRRLVCFFGTPQLLERASKLLGPVWAHGFGSTEQGAVTTRLLPHEVAEKPERVSSVGRPGSPFLELAIKDPQGKTLPPRQVGEIVVRSAMSLGEYWGMPDKTEAASFPGGWFRPFDIGYIDEDGFLYYADRAGDTIHTRAGAVYPHQVEAALFRHEAVVNCGVVGLGEAGAQEVVAAVQLKPGWPATPELASAILAATCADLPERERPARLTFTADLPTVLGGARYSGRSCARGLRRSSPGRWPHAGGPPLQRGPAHRD
jgi:acyl-CoA synthetase (AMP-forming)/AMP-acid ligase II